MAGDGEEEDQDDDDDDDDEGSDVSQGEESPQHASF